MVDFLRARRRSLLPAGVVVGALAAGPVALRRWLDDPVPGERGAIRLPGLGAEVEILRDRWGVPHVYAASADDLFFAQGFATAQDRLWQMELLRRAASGTLAEIVGPRGLATDRFFRRLGLARRAEAEPISGEGGRALGSYVAGVNAWISAAEFRRPAEFRLLRCAPAAWTAAQVLAIAKLLTWLLSTNWQTEYVRSLLVERLGATAAERLEADYPSDHPTIVAAVSGPATGARDLPPSDFGRAFRAAGGASNAWAVAGWRSSSGRPLLANDVHLAPQLPGLWYEVHLEGGGYHVAGATIPGVPGVVVGHNRRVAWGVTVSMVDTQDLYVEQIYPSDGSRYRFAGDWLSIDRRIETFAVRGRTGLFVETMAETAHGPIITPLLPMSEKRALALRCASREPSSPQSILDLDRAGNWEEFRAALAGWTTGCLNFVFADVAGNIGYQLAGRVPIRARGDGSVPAPGWSGDHEWRGFIPPDELPSTLNPPHGIVVSANNRIAPPDYPRFLGREWANGYRARRIRELLLARPRHHIRSFAAISADRLSLAATDMRGALVRVSPRTETEVRALAVFRRWDCRVEAGSAGAALYEVWREHLVRALVRDELGGLTDLYLGAGLHELVPSQGYHSRVTSRLVSLLGNSGVAESPERNPAEVEALVAASFSSAVAELASRLGPRPERWRWDALHPVHFRHPLGVGPLGRLLNRGGFGVGGDIDTVAQTAADAAAPYGVAGPASAYRLIVDLADFDRSRSLVAIGQSGHPGSRHFADQLRLWRRGGYHAMPFSRSAVVKSGVNRLVIRPT